MFWGGVLLIDFRIIIKAVMTTIPDSNVKRKKRMWDFT